MINRLNINKTLITVISINVLQILILSGYFLYSILTNGTITPAKRLDPGSLLLIVLVLTTLINSFYIIKDARYLHQYDLQYEMLKESLAQVEELNKILRSQRHDFRNHLQVVYSLIEMDEYSEVKSYVERVYTDIHKVSRSLRTSNPAINALLQAKMLDCEKKDIEVLLNVSTQLKDLQVPAWEMCRILGNLIDNAIHALEANKGQRLLNIEIFDDSNHHVFLVEDNGPKIPEEISEKIFEPGYTTKGAKGEGLGLAITRKIVIYYNGTIEVKSTDAATSFIVKIPFPIQSVAED